MSFPFLKKSSKRQSKSTSVHSIVFNGVCLLLWILFSSKSFGTDFEIPPDPNNVQYVLDSSTADSLTVHSGLTTNGFSAVVFNFDSGDAQLDLVIDPGANVNSNFATTLRSQAGGGTGSIFIHNQGNLNANANTLVTDFSATDVPVLLFQDGPTAQILVGTVNLSTQAPGTATLQLGSHTSATNTVDFITGNANSVIDVENTYTTSNLDTIDGVGTIYSNTIGGNIFTVRDAMGGPGITGFNEFINTATSTTRTIGDVIGNANAEITNAGVWNHEGAIIQGVNLDFFNSGTYSMTNVVSPPTLNLNGGVFTNETTGIVNLNNGSTYIANTINFGTFNANAGSILHNSIIFFRNFGGTLNLATAFTLPGSGLPNTGIVNINNGGTLTDEDGSGFTNDGVYNLNPGGALVTDLFNNRGIFNINTGFTIPGSGLSNTGTVNINNGGTLTDGDGSGFTNDGTYNLFQGGSLVTNIFRNHGFLNLFENFTIPGYGLTNTGTVSIYNGATLTNADNSPLVNRGTYNVFAGANLVTNNFTNFGLFNLYSNFALPGSNLSNNGTINIYNGATLTDSNNSGIVNNGTYNLFAGGNLFTVRFTNDGFFNIYGTATTSVINNGTLNVYSGGILNDTTPNGISNFGITNLFAGGQIFTSSFLNNGIFNVYVATLPFPVTSTVPYSVVNLFTNFFTSFPFTNVPTITLNSPATTFLIQNPITNLVTLTMGPGMMTFLEPNGSITTTTLTLSNAGTLVLNGGTLSGNLVGNPAASLIVAKSFSTNGFISGLGSIYVTGGVFTINNPVTGYSLFQNSSTVVMNGGTLSGGMFGSGANSSLIIQKDFATAGTFSGIGTIQVLNGATFTINNPVIGYNLFQNLGRVVLNPGGTIDGGMQGGGAGSSLVFNTSFTTQGILGQGAPLDTVFINPGSTLTMNHRINANTLYNNGELVLSNSQILTGNYQQTGRLTTFIQGPGTNQFGQLIVTGNAIVGGTINAVLLNDGAFFDNEQTLDVIVASSVTNNGVQAITTSSNPFVQFTIDRRAGVPSNVIRLVLNRVPFRRFTGDDPLIAGVADVLDNLRIRTLTPKFREVLLKIRGISNGDLLREDLSQLVPNVNGDALMTALAVNDLIVDKIDHQLSKNHREKRRIHYGYGYMAGDLPCLEGTVGPIFFGNRLQQANRGLVEGYASNTRGFGILGDQWLNNWFKVGGALTYAQSGIKSNRHKNHTHIYSVQGTAYATLDAGEWYIDGYFSFASNRYHRNRNISFVSSTASSSSSGYQVAETLRAGYNIPFYIYQFTPLAVAQHFHLRQGSYSERGPGPTLKIKSDSRHLMRVGVGAKLVAELTPNDEFVPEIHALWIQDLNKSHIQLTSSFTEVGPAFLVGGPTLPRTAINVGAGVTAQLVEDFYGIIEFNYEKRKQLSSRTVIAKLRYIF